MYKEVWEREAFKFKKKIILHDVDFCRCILNLFSLKRPPPSD